ncbi:hypothetical protein PR048_006746 [Dryococelus australis]|uniref:Uncharacterized protein n=1 Tax=Dryococelus australis TaxID=614101 RepID=A0ABQ9IBW3_9NEOP|nr:hypothetical protein PR048_006746 [Dryococelus australis]
MRVVWPSHHHDQIEENYTLNNTLETGTSCGKKVPLKCHQVLYKSCLVSIATYRVKNWTLNVGSDEDKKNLESCCTSKSRHTGPK